MLLCLMRLSCSSCRGSGIGSLLPFALGSQDQSPGFILSHIPHIIDLPLSRHTVMVPNPWCLSKPLVPCNPFPRIFSFHEPCLFYTPHFSSLSWTLSLTLPLSLSYLFAITPHCQSLSRVLQISLATLFQPHSLEAFGTNLTW